MSAEIIRPDADQSIDWLPVGSEDHFANIDDDVEQPAVPNTTDHNDTADENYIDEYDLSDPVTRLNVTAINLWIYCKKAAGTTLTLGFKVKSSPLTIIDDNLTIPNTDWAWINSEATELNLTPAQIDAIRLSLKIIGANNNTIYVAAAYLKLTFAEGATAEPLALRSKPMSGYNYFVRNYILRKNLELTPYKLPDGTLF